MNNNKEKAENNILSILNEVFSNCKEMADKTDQAVEKIAIDDKSFTGDLARSIIKNHNHIQAILIVMTKRLDEFEDSLAKIDNKYNHLQKLFEMVCDKKLDDK